MIEYFGRIKKNRGKTQIQLFLNVFFSIKIPIYATTYHQ